MPWRSIKMENEPKFYLNTEYVNLMPKQEPYVPRIEFGADINKVSLTEFSAPRPPVSKVNKELSYGRFYFYDVWDIQT